MEFLQLRYFYESAQNENFAKTAEKFMVPASSVSASVKRLEQELGVELFDRSSNRIKLNAKGHLFAEALDEIFGKLESSISQITEKSSPKKEISILIKARRKWITDLIIEYKEKHPDVHFRISNDFYITEFDEFDIIVDEQSENYGEWARFILSVEKICIKASKDSPLVGQQLSFRQLREQPFVMTRKSSGVRKLLESTAKCYGFVPNVAIECNDSYCLLRYVKTGMGLTLGSYRALSDEVEKDVVALDVIDFNEIQSVYVYHRRFEPGDCTLLEFCEFLKCKGKV